MKDLGSHARVQLPVHAQLRVVLVRPHYPENLGAAARALKTMGFSRLVMVSPGRLCSKEHDMAFKMAVKSWDVLDATQVCRSIDEAVQGCTFVVGTTARRGVAGVVTPRSLGPELAQRAALGQELAILFGNEKTGLGSDELASCHAQLRIPMAADQPSVNLAQSVQIVVYEMLVAALDLRNA